MIDTVTFDLWNTLMANAPPDMQKYRARRVQKMERLLRRNGTGSVPTVCFLRMLGALRNAKKPGAGISISPPRNS